MERRGGRGAVSERGAEAGSRAGSRAPGGHGVPGAPAGGAGLTRRPALRGAAGALAGVLGAACGGGAAGGAAGPASPAAGPVALRYFTDWSGGTRADWVKAALPRFSEERPGVTLTAEFAQGDAKEAVLANAAAGTLSEVVLGGGDIPHQLARAGALAEITPALKSQRVKMDDVVWIPSTIQVKGKQYGMPFQWNYWARVINTTLFRQAGVPLPTEKTTWPQLADSLQKISKPEQDVYGIETGSAIWFWFPNVWAAGGEAITADQKKTVVDQAAAIEGLQFYTDLMLRQRVGTPMDGKGALATPARFVNGTVAVSHANAPGKGLDGQIGGKFEWDVMYLPLGPKTGKRAVFVSEQPNIVTAAAARRGGLEAAVAFAVWACTSKTAQELLLDIGTNSWPTSKAVLNSPRYLAGPPTGVKAMVEMIKDFKDPHIFAGWLEWRQALIDALNPAFAGQTGVPAAAREAVRAGDAVLARNAA
jgi:ABC-type glycerol-3-phosphate transport system substrate-binding protein